MDIVWAVLLGIGIGILITITFLLIWVLHAANVSMERKNSDLKKELEELRRK